MPAPSQQVANMQQNTTCPRRVQRPAQTELKRQIKSRNARFDTIEITSSAIRKTREINALKEYCRDVVPTETGGDQDYWKRTYRLDRPRPEAIAHVAKYWTRCRLSVSRVDIALELAADSNSVATALQNTLLRSWLPKYRHWTHGTEKVSDETFYAHDWDKVVFTENYSSLAPKNPARGGSMVFYADKPAETPGSIGKRAAKVERRFIGSTSVKAQGMSDFNALLLMTLDNFHEFWKRELRLFDVNVDAYFADVMAGHSEDDARRIIALDTFSEDKLGKVIPAVCVKDRLRQRIYRNTAYRLKKVMGEQLPNDAFLPAAPTWHNDTPANALRRLRRGV